MIQCSHTETQKEMKMFKNKVRPSSLTAKKLSTSTLREPLRVTTVNNNLFDIYKILDFSGYRVKNVSQGSDVEFSSLDEVKYYISCFN